MKISQIRQSNSQHLYVLSAALLLGIIATYVFAFGSTVRHDTPTSFVPVTTSAPSVNISKKPVDLQTAQKIAQAQKPHATVSKVEKIPKQEEVAYSVHFTDGTIINVSADDGAIIKEGEATIPESEPQSSTEAPTNSEAPSSNLSDMPETANESETTQTDESLAPPDNPETDDF